jgi:hypothetical protein
MCAIDWTTCIMFATKFIVCWCNVEWGLNFKIGFGGYDHICLSKLKMKIELFMWIEMGVARAWSFPMVENNMIGEPRNTMLLQKMKKT